MIDIAARLSLAGGRDAAVRLALTVLGVAFGVALLLFALSVESAAQQRAARQAQRGHTGAAVDRPDGASVASRGLAMTVSEDRFRGRSMTHVFVAALGSDAPVPPGLPRLPRTGEAFVSPALADLLVGDEAALLRQRLPDDIAVGQLGRPALLSPWELVAWVGVDPKVLISAGDAQIVDDFPLGVSPTGWWTAKLPVRLGIVVALIGLVLPALIFIGVMARLGAAQRARRLAVLRLVGATPAQARLAVGIEAAVAAAVGSVAGVGVFAALRPLAARMSVDGARWFPADFTPPTWAVGALLLGVPALSAVAAILALRRVTISPLGVSRRTRNAHPSPLRLTAVAIGGVGLVASAAAANVLPTGRLVAMAAISLAVLLAGLPAAGPWMTTIAANEVATRARRPSVLLAARRLQADPTTAFRAASGIMAALFVATIFYGYSNGNIGEILPTDLPHGDDGAHINTAEVDPATVTRLLTKLPDVDGVRSQLAIRHAYGEREALPNVNIADCAALNDYHLAKLEPCPGTSLFINPRTRVDLPDRIEIHAQPDQPQATSSGTIPVPDRVGHLEHGQITVVDRHSVLSGSIVVDPELLPNSFVDTLPVHDVFIRTDGNPDTIERIRNLAIPLLPGHEVNTQHTLAAELNRPIHEAQHGVHVLVAITLVVATASAAAATAGTILERRRPFTLLRASGAPASTLHATVLIETAIPLALAGITAAGLGLAAAAVFVEAVDADFAPPISQIAALTAASIAAGLSMAAATLPIINRATIPRELRTE